MTRLSSCVLLVALIATTVPAVAQDCDDLTPEQMTAGQQKTMAIMGPGPEHELLTKLVGEWSATVNMYMPGMDTMSSPMTSTNEMILEGRFLRSTSKGSMMGMPVESVTMFGYDRRHGHYTMMGFDTMGTYFITASGEYDEATRTLSLNGTDDDPILGVVQDYTFDVIFNDDGSVEFGLTFNCPTMGTGAPYRLMDYTWVKAKEE
jgi:hypothetical protein